MPNLCSTSHYLNTTSCSKSFPLAEFEEIPLRVGGIIDPFYFSRGDYYMSISFVTDCHCHCLRHLFLGPICTLNSNETHPQVQPHAAHSLEPLWYARTELRESRYRKCCNLHRKSC
jgi:hypothetical protein